MENQKYQGPKKGGAINEMAKEAIDGKLNVSLGFVKPDISGSPKVEFLQDKAGYGADIGKDKDKQAKKQLDGKAKGVDPSSKVSGLKGCMGDKDGFCGSSLLSKG